MSLFSSKICPYSTRHLSLFNKAFVFIQQGICSYSTRHLSLFNKAFVLIQQGICPYCFKLPVVVFSTVFRKQYLHLQCTSCCADRRKCRAAIMMPGAPKAWQVATYSILLRLRAQQANKMVARSHWKSSLRHLNRSTFHVLCHFFHWTSPQRWMKGLS